MVLNHNQITTL